MIEVGQYVRLKNRTLQCPQIARIIKISKDSGYKNQYYIELDKNLIPSYEYHIYEEDISKASFKLIDLIEVGDVISVRIHGDISKYEVEQFDLKGKIIGIRVQILEDIRIFELKDLDIISILTKEQFKVNEYKV